MRKLITIVVLLGMYLHSVAQEKSRVTLDFTVSVGNSILVNKLNGISHQLSPQSISQLLVNFPVGKTKFISSGMGYETNRHLIDGIFTKNQDQFSFQLAPANYTQNEILLDYLNIPVLFKQKAGESSNSDFHISFGPVFSFLVLANQKAKINGTKQKVEAPVENKFRFGMGLDFDIKKKNKGAKGIFGGGLYYQITKNQKDSKSFTPLTAYFRVGFGS